MIILDWLTWWYGTAWNHTWQKILVRARTVLEAFSVPLLARTLFAPFRQIDAGGVRGPLDVQLRAWFDRTFSRVFGAIVRTIMILTGLASAGIVIVAGALWAILWPFLPVMPLIGLLLSVTGWTLG